MKAKGRREEPTTATTPEEAFLQAIHANITDPAPWQMYADWLEERGDPNAILYRERRVTGALGITFVTVPAGTFWIGGGGGEPGKQQQSVQAFQMDIHPVTQEQWQAVMGSNPSRFSRQGRSRDSVKAISDEELRHFPVENVSWNDVQMFIGMLNEREQGRGWFYRLPPELEWEYACRGGVTSGNECSFHFYVGKPSNDLSSTQANFKPAKGPYLERTTKVGSYPPNVLGIFDMHGNVWEWCEDVAEGGPARVLRGGCWYYDDYHCQASYQDWLQPTDRVSYVGFRLARSPSSSKQCKGPEPAGPYAG